MSELPPSADYHDSKWTPAISQGQKIYQTQVGRQDLRIHLEAEAGRDPLHSFTPCSLTGWTG